MNKPETRVHQLLGMFIVIGALFGSWRTISQNGEINGNDLLYFTIQSNLWIAAIHLYFLMVEVYERRHENFTTPNGVRILKYVLTVSITLTFLVFFFVLVPQLGLFVVQLPGSMLTHFWVPLAAILDYLLFERKQISSGRTISLCVLPPFIYFVVTILLSVSGVTYADNQPVPYFFLNYKELGWFKIAGGRIGVFYWLLIMLVVILFLAMLLLRFNQGIRKRRAK
ncbi:MAG TPA: Pr6Pr family membrane protein [Clostridiaceae bacterium]|nr:Pr6Pr family membrane protein [Clostridiaceae bacterium]